jgi:hypothetical protein
MIVIFCKVGNKGPHFEVLFEKYPALASSWQVFPFGQ